ncbi:MAG: zinc-binding dehydrogenase [Cyclobacteriaceae bacterium]|nr:zinc-binding dehydrogenase [Cyclobacteriaceae bacterium]
MSGISRKIWLQPKAGDLKRLVQKDDYLSSPAAGELQIEIKAIGLNFADIFAIFGLYSATPTGSFVPGLEYAGVVVQVGDGVSRFRVGDRIMGVTRFGAYTTHLNIAQEYVYPLPQNWSFAQGAAFPVQTLTAYYALCSLGNAQSGDTVLIHSAAGGVGMMANRIAKSLGCYTIGTVGSESKLDLLKQEGYDDYLVRARNMRAELEEKLIGRELNLILESVGGDVFRMSYDLLAREGRLVTFGSAVFGQRRDRPNMLKVVWNYLRRPRIDPMKMVSDNKSVMAFNLIWLYDKKGKMGELMRELDILQLAAPFVGHRFDFEDLPEAIRLFQSGKTMGKVVVQLS